MKNKYNNAFQNSLNHKAKTPKFTSANTLQNKEHQWTRKVRCNSWKVVNWSEEKGKENTSALSLQLCLLHWREKRQVEKNWTIHLRFVSRDDPLVPVMSDWRLPSSEEDILSQTINPGGGERNKSCLTLSAEHRHQPWLAIEALPEVTRRRTAERPEKFNGVMRKTSLKLMTV